VIVVVPRITWIRSSMNADAWSDSDGSACAAETPDSQLMPYMSLRIGVLQPHPEALNILRRDFRR
jgi:hypothetical protein